MNGNRSSIKLEITADFADTSENRVLVPIVIGAPQAATDPSYGSAANVSAYTELGAFWRGAGADYDLLNAKSNAPTVDEVNSGDVYFAYEETIGGPAQVVNWVRVRSLSSSVSSAAAFYEALRTGTFQLAGADSISMAVNSGQESQLDQELSYVYAQGAFGGLQTNDLGTETFRKRSDNDPTVRNWQFAGGMNARRGLRLSIATITTTFTLTLSGIYTPDSVSV